MPGFSLTAEVNFAVSNGSLQRIANQLRTGLSAPIPVALSLPSSTLSTVKAIGSNLNNVLTATHVVNSAVNQTAAAFANANAQAQQLLATSRHLAAVQPAAPAGPAAPPSPASPGRSPAQPSALSSVRGAYRAEAIVGRLSQVVDPGPARSNVATPGTFVASRGLVGGLEGAVGGAFLAGPAGAVAGGLFGLTTALARAAKEVEDARIGQVLTRAADDFRAAAGRFSFGGRGVGGVDDLAAGADKLTSAVARNFQSETGPLQTNLLDIVREFRGDASEVTQQIVAANKKALEEVGPGALEAVQKQASRLGGGNLGVDPNELLRRLTSDKSNAAVLNVIASSRAEADASPTKFAENVRQERETISRRDLLPLIQEGQRRALQVQTSALNDAASTTALKSMEDGLHGAADSLAQLRARTEVLAGEFNGAGAALKVALPTTRLGATGAVGAAIGGAGGADFARQGEALRSALDQVPNLLRDVAASKPQSPEAFARAVEAKLGATALPRQVQQTILSGLNGQLFRPDGQGVNDVTARAGLDAKGLTEELLRGLTTALDSATKRSAAELSANANNYLAGQQQFQQQRQTIGQGQDRLGDLGLARARAEAELTARFTGGNATDRLTLDQLQAPFLARQSRLTGFNGAAATDPSAIGGALTQVQGQIAAQAKKVQESFAATGGRGPEFQRAADSLAALQSKAQDLRAALVTLTQTSTTAAAAQEKLGRLQADQQGRLGLAERFATADAQGRFRLNEQAGLATRAIAVGKLDQFAPEQQRDIVEFLRTAGQTKLTGAGGVRADEALQQLLTKSFGGIFAPDKQSEKERKDLEGQVKDAFVSAAQAEQQLIADQKQLSADFFRDLTANQQAFLEALGQVMGQPGQAGKGAGPEQAGPPVPRARGGFVGRDIHRDRRLVMMEEQEFVVNSKSAASNMDLLRSINASSGPVALADGGPVGDDDLRKKGFLANPGRLVRGGNGVVMTGGQFLQILGGIVAPQVARAKANPARGLPSGRELIERLYGRAPASPAQAAEQAHNVFEEVQITVGSIRAPLIEFNRAQYAQAAYQARAENFRRLHGRLPTEKEDAPPPAPDVAARDEALARARAIAEATRQDALRGRPALLPYLGAETAPDPEYQQSKLVTAAKAARDRATKLRGDLSEKVGSVGDLEGALSPFERRNLDLAEYRANQATQRASDFATRGVRGQIAALNRRGVGTLGGGSDEQRQKLAQLQGQLLAQRAAVEGRIGGRPAPDLAVPDRQPDAAAPPLAVPAQPGAAERQRLIPGILDDLRAGRGPQPLRFAAGGIVPGTPGAGDDNVLAALTPGERVIPRGQAGTAGGLTVPPELKSAFDGFSRSVSDLTAPFNSFGATVSNLQTALASFGSTGQKLTEVLSHLKDLKVTHEGRFDVNVIVNGQEAFAKMQEPLRQMVESKIVSSINQMLSRKFAGVGGIDEASLGFTGSSGSSGSTSKGGQS